MKHFFYVENWVLLQLTCSKITDLSYKMLDTSAGRSFCLDPSGLFGFRSPVQLPSRSGFATGLKRFLQSWGPWYNPPVEGRTDEDFVVCSELTSSQANGDWSALAASWAPEVSSRFSWLAAIDHLQTFCYRKISWGNIVVSILLFSSLLCCML